jgi:hypothetical protein
VFFVDDETVQKKNIVRLIDCLPKLKDILKFVKSKRFNDEKRRNEVFFTRICLEIYHRFSKVDECIAQLNVFSFPNIVTIQDMLECHNSI